MAKFKVGDIVKVVRPSTNYPNQAVDWSDDTAREIIEVCQPHRFIVNKSYVQMYDLSPSTNYYMDEISLEFASQPVSASSANWGNTPPVTSSSGRKISDDERKLIELRIATRRALHGGE